MVLNLKHKGKKGLLFILMVLALTIFALSNVSASPSSNRIAGYTKYDTSSAIAKAGWTQSDYAVLAYGENYPDALAATPLAKKYNAPILLTERLNLTPVTKQTLQDLKVKAVFIVGGTAVISPTVEAQLSEIGIGVSRYAGYDKYDTAIEIAKGLGTVQEISVVTGDDFPDALSVGSIAAMNNSPIILAPRDQLTESIKGYLSTASILKTYIIGNTDQISDSVANQFPNAERIAGSEKYARNIAVLKKFDASYNFDNVFLATGNGFADALTGAAYAARISAPIVLVDKNPLQSATQEYLNAKLPSSKNLSVLGGTAVIPSSLVDVILGAPATIPTGQKLKVSYIDVGQADSILIQIPGGKNVLIDAGNNEDANTITSYLKQQGVSKLDVVIATHPHEDHIGAMDTVINTFDIGQVIMPKKDSTTQTYKDLITAIQNKGLKITEAKAGLNLDLGSEVNAVLVAPSLTAYEDVNNYSAVLKLTYGNSTFLFESDAEEKSECEMCSTNYDLRADVLKVGHHGSNSSSSMAFLAKVQPKYAVISVGKDNSYGHPASTTIDKLANIGAKVFRTDQAGTIVIESDGTNITTNAIASEVQPRAPDQTVYITKSGTKYHADGCSSLSKSKIPISLTDAKSKGYTPCSLCNPPQ
jgi:Predicted hydrolase (metallo-beta-lactamase superfamily)